MIKHPSEDYALMNALRFDMADLESNRSGTLTAQQIRRLPWSIARQTLFVPGIGIPVIVVMLLLRNSVDGIMIGVGVVGLVCLGWVWSVATQVFKIRSDANNIQAATGKLTVWYTGPQAHPALQKERGISAANRQEPAFPLGPIHQLIIGQIQFPVYKNVRYAFRQDCHYTVYYAPSTKRIVSAEEIEPPTDPT